MLRRLSILATILFLAFNAAAKGKIIIRSLDGKGIGFDDPTPVAPVGGNPGTTLGQQRLIVFQEAARRWQNSLDTNVDIVVSATFAPIGACEEDTATLGSASAVLIHSFSGAPRPHVWYPMALANKLAGTDLNGSQEEIKARFNADVDKPECLSSTNSDWYYGLDSNHGDDVDLFVVVLHELAHGLGFSGVGAEFIDNRPSVFESHMYDATTGLRWDQMSVEQRRASVTNTGNVLWDGPNVRDNIARYLTPVTTLTVTQPSAIARDYDIGLASFGAVARLSALSGKVVLATDGTDDTSSSTTDGCSALTNAAQIAGNIALIDRNNCAFVIKALNAQAAGATGVIISNMPLEGRDETCYAPGMAGTSEEVRIPVVSLSTNDGAALKAQLATNAQVQTTLRNDPARLSGASPEGYVRLYSPCVQEPGSSTYHWDTVASPNLLMEPSVSSDLAHGLDLTLNQLLDIGWTLPARSGRTILKR